MKFNSILLIDDKVGNNRYNHIILEQMNIFKAIEIAEHGEEALKVLENADITQSILIFLDINMPRMNGWEFLEAYKTSGLDKKMKNLIIMLTTSMNPEDKLKADKIPIVAEFCIKPLTPEKIREIIEKYSQGENV